MHTHINILEIISQMFFVFFLNYGWGFSQQEKLDSLDNIHQHIVLVLNLKYGLRFSGCEGYSVETLDLEL